VDAVQHDESSLVLTDAQRDAIHKRALHDLRRAIVVQGASALFAGLVCWLGFGRLAGVSALLGAGAYYLPNALFALRLMLGMLAARPLTPLVFLLVEMLKLGLAVALLAGIAWAWQEWLVWPALLFGLVCVLKGYVVALLLGK